MTAAPRLHDAALIAALRAGDERAFVQLTDSYGAGMRRLALALVRDAELADDVVQEAWAGVLRGLDGFDGRASLKTWIFGIAVTIARTHVEGQPNFAREVSDDEPALDPSRFRHPQYPGGWTAFPGPWAPVDAGEARGVVAAAIDSLPPAQRVVILLRDVEGWSADDVCNVLELSETTQRVLLHRARSRVRAAVERHLQPS